MQCTCNRLHFKCNDRNQRLLSRLHQDVQSQFTNLKTRSDLIILSYNNS